ncbi:glycoside hydrolase family 55 protein [Clostridium estertheticum]|uniref:Glycoside hydrolase family 55 protein n=1 Tax=Clostridium estertheticum TaxID=238834 RepID=A0AA47I7J3_9CLOT|nr:glycoside hydrolase family 55 protein [Clostridium estertheticum]MBU3153509.1 glycoside hydrolase family 55 protein [Clostridium estertheticum]WAG60910.1 glycoside hydrolase family 55 protein [Clostridium estertheticum]
MANVTNDVANIRAAVFGKDVRESIADGIEDINTEVTSTTARQLVVEGKQTAVGVRQDLADCNEIIRKTNEIGRINVEGERVTEFNVIKTDYDTYKNVMIAESNVAALQNGINKNTSDLANMATNPMQFGAKFDGITDDTNAINLAIKTALKNGNAKIIFPQNSKCKIAGMILIPSNVIIDCNSCEINGGGGNTIFETGYVLSGEIVSNISTPNETQRVVFSQIINISKITNCELCFNVFNFNEGCEISNVYAFMVGKVLNSKRSFYSSYTNITDREAGYVNDTYAKLGEAFSFDGFVNVEHLKSLFVTGRGKGFRFSGGSDGQEISGCSAEDVNIGIEISGEVHLLGIYNNYFESIRQIAVNIDNVGVKRNITIDRNWFYGCPVAIHADNFSGHIGKYNYYSGGTNLIEIPDNTTSIGEIEFLKSSIPATSNGILSTTIQANIGDECTVKENLVIYDDNSGLGLAKAIIYNKQVPLIYNGHGGFAPNRVMFTDTKLLPLGSSVYNIEISTGFIFDPYNFLIFRFKITDNNGAYDFYGKTYGEIVKLDNVDNGRLVTLTIVHNKIVLTLSSFTHPSGIVSCEGIIRMA